MKALIIAAVCLISSSAKGNVANFEPSKDNTVYQTNLVALSNGAGPYFYAGRTSPMQVIDLQIRRGLLQFDLSDIPPGSVINSVNLRLLIVSHRNDSSVALHVAESDWGEGTSDAGNPGGAGTLATTDDATWLAAFYESINWNNVGGDFNISQSASVAYTENGYINLTDTGMVSDVQDWIDGTSNNYGWFIIGDESSDSTAVRFGSRENFDTSFRPRLTIDFTPPPIELTLFPVQDNTLYESTDGSTSNGVGNTLFIGKTGNNGGNKIRRAVMKFDLNSIPPVADVQSVQLEVTVSNVGNSAQNFTGLLHLLLEDWGEGDSTGGGSGGASANGDATWLHRFYDNLNWSTAGGEYSATVSADSEFGTINQTITFSDSILLADVQTWVQNPGMNHGWILLGDEITNGNARGIGSRESNIPPELNIEYTLPDMIFIDGFE